MGLFVCVELAYIGIHCEMAFFLLHGVGIHRNSLMEWAYFLTWNWNTKEVIDSNGLICLHGIGMHRNSLSNELICLH